MCGLVGLFGKNLSLQDEKVFRDLLYLDVLRGEDSTGAAIVSVPFLPNQPEVVELVKAVGPPSVLYGAHGRYQGKSSLTLKTGLKLLLGHNRYATQGLISAENAHPFEMGEVVGAHNGTLRKSSLEGLHEASKYEVDSQIIYSHLGAGNSLQSVWEVADGAMALTWYNKSTKKLCLIRNKERPLYTCISKDGKTLYWSSESWMLHIALSRSGVKDVGDITPLPENTLREIDLDDKGHIVSVDTAIPPFVRKPVVNYTGHPYGSNYWGEDWLDRPAQKAKTWEKPQIFLEIKEVVPNASVPHGFGTTKDGEEVKIIFAKGNAKTVINNVLQRGLGKGTYVTTNYYRVHSSGQGAPALTCQYSDLTYFKKKALTKGFGGETLTGEQFAQRMKCGCSNCMVVPAWKDKDELRWFDKEVFLCAECKSLPWVDDLANTYGMM